jgi:hypothetical protein
MNEEQWCKIFQGSGRFAPPGENFVKNLPLKKQKSTSLRSDMSKSSLPARGRTRNILQLWWRNSLATAWTRKTVHSVDNVKCEDGEGIN